MMVGGSVHCAADFDAHCITRVLLVVMWLHVSDVLCSTQLPTSLEMDERDAAMMITDFWQWQKVATLLKWYM